MTTYADRFIIEDLSECMSPDFVDGFLSACQGLALSHGRPELAEDLMQGSNLTREELLRAQSRSGFEDEQMISIIESGMGVEE